MSGERIENQILQVVKSYYLDRSMIFPQFIQRLYNLLLNFSCEDSRTVAKAIAEMLEYMDRRLVLGEHCSAGVFNSLKRIFPDKVTKWLDEQVNYTVNVLGNLMDIITDINKKRQYEAIRRSRRILSIPYHRLNLLMAETFRRERLSLSLIHI